MHTPSPSTDQLLSDILSRAGLVFELRQNQNGVPYAGFRLEIEPGEFLGFTAIIRGSVLQLIAHQVLQGPATSSLFWRLNEMNCQWGLGRAYNNHERSCVDASVGLYVGGDSFDTFSVSQSLKNLRSAAWTIRYSLGSGEALNFYEQQLLDILPGQNADDLSDVQQALHSTGHPFSASQQGRVLTQLFQQAASPPFRVEFVKRDSRFLCMYARLQLDFQLSPEHLMKTVQNLNSRLAFGATVVDQQALSLMYCAMLPLAWTSINPGLCAWLLDYVSAAIQFQFDLINSASRP